jgi:hypothetical protein
LGWWYRNNIDAGDNVMSPPLRYGAPDEAGMSSARVRHVAHLAESWVAQGMTPALVVLIARRGIIVLHEAFGRLDPESDSPLPLDAVFPLGSITKAISAATAMTLVEDGSLGLNRPLSEYLPELVGQGKDAVMVHHLMTHTSGFRDDDVAEHIAHKRSTGEIPTPDDSGNLLLAFAQRAGGEAGARLARVAGVPASPHTLRRLLRRQEFIVDAAPTELGVDEFALHRGPLRYGLLLVDLAVRRPVDVLPDDEPATLATWLRTHAGAKVIARDRGHRIREGVSLGAPSAVQVADCFHLLRNVVDALDKLQRQRRAAGSAAFGHGVRAPPAPKPDPPPPPDPTLLESKPGERLRSFRAGPDQWERARALRAQG